MSLVYSCHHNHDENTAQKLFPKFCLDIQSSKTNIRLCAFPAIAFTVSDRLKCSSPITWDIIKMSVANMQSVWKESVPPMSDASAASIEPYQRHHHDDRDGNGTPIASKTKRCRMKQTIIETHRCTGHLGKQEKCCARFVRPLSETSLQVCVDGGEIQFVIGGQYQKGDLQNSQEWIPDKSACRSCRCLEPCPEH